MARRDTQTDKLRSDFARHNEISKKAHELFSYLGRADEPAKLEPPLEIKFSDNDKRSLDRILEAVGKKFIPANLNRKALWAAIKKAGETKKIIARWRPARVRPIVKAMKRISRAANSLAAVIKENDDAMQLFADIVPHQPDGDEHNRANNDQHASSTPRLPAA
jgi:hypothetical protein